MKDKTKDIVIKKRPIRALRHLSKIGAAPGTINIHPDLAQYGIKLVLTTYNETEFIELEITDPNEIVQYLQKYPVSWLAVYGFGSVSALEKIAQIFNFHKLAMEDVVNVHQRPKVEEYGDILFAVTRMPYITNSELNLEQVSVFWGKNFVVTFMERPGDCLDPLRARIKNDDRRQHLLRSEYLGYAIIDTIVDSFFPVMEIYGLQLDDIEEDAIINPTRKIIIGIHDFKRDLAVLRRAMWSQREAIRSLSEIANFNNAEMRFFIRDCEDHTIQLIDILESYRERTAGLMDIYLSSLNNKMNEIMKVLTMIATIFMPLSFVASLYGMNFDREASKWNMPELGWEFGYIYSLGLMLIITSIQLYFFWRRGWLKRHR